MKKDQELIVITKTYDLVLRSCNHTSTIPPQGQVRLTEGLERRVQLYEDTDIPGEAAKRRKKTVQNRVKP
jgi:hypothetical protein